MRCSRELELERELLAPPLETSTSVAARRRSRSRRSSERLLAALPEADEVTVEANPETVTPAAAALLRRAASLASRSARRRFQPELLGRARAARRRRTTSGVPSTISVMPDLTTSRSISSTASPARAPPISMRDIAEALALGPEHLSCYELEAKPGLASRTPRARSSCARQMRWRRTSSASSTADRRRLPLVRDGELLPQSSRHGISDRATTSRTGSDATTSVSASAPSRRSTARVAKRRRASLDTSPRLQRVSSRPGARASRRGCARPRALDARPSPRRAVADRGRGSGNRRGRRSIGSCSSAS